VTVTRHEAPESTAADRAFEPIADEDAPLERSYRHLEGATYRSREDGVDDVLDAADHATTVLLPSRGTAQMALAAEHTLRIDD
jgi:hypothetical protein